MNISWFVFLYTINNTHPFHLHHHIGTQHLPSFLSECGLIGKNHIHIFAPNLTLIFSTIVCNRNGNRLQLYICISIVVVFKHINILCIQTNIDNENEIPIDNIDMKFIIFTVEKVYPIAYNDD